MAYMSGVDKLFKWLCDDYTNDKCIIFYKQSTLKKYCRIGTCDNDIYFDFEWRQF